MNTPKPPAPPVSLLETILYSTDLAAAHAFYAGVLGLKAMSDKPSTLCAGFRIGPGQVLLVFNPEISGQPGRDVPSHGVTGPGHLALRVPPEDLDAWAAHLESVGVGVEQRIEWDGERGRSVYCRDPAGNSVELIDTDIWPEG